MSRVDVQLILNKLDIVEVIQSYITLQAKGKNFVGICPFHQDTSPSLSVSREKQIFKCFSCGESGNAITFIQKYNNITYPEALRIAADKAGVEIEVTQRDDDIPDRIKRIHQMNATIVDYSNYLLHQNEDLKRYLYERELSLESIDRFGIGCFSETDKFIKFMLAKGFTEAELIENEMINSNGWSRWEKRLLIPIKDSRSNIVGFTARQLDNDSRYPKYVNSTESEVFKKEKILYNMDQAYNAAQKQKFILVVEGNVDVLQLTANGYDNVVATMGTSLTESQIKQLKQMNIGVVLCFDGDTAGIKAAERNYYLLKHAGVEAEVILLPDKMDPDDCIKQNPDSFKRLLNEHPHFLDFKLGAFSEVSNFNETQKFIIDFMKALANQNNPIAEDFFLKKLASTTNIDFEKVNNQYNILNSKKTYEAFNVEVNSKRKVIPKKNNVQTTRTFINFKNKPKLDYKKEMSEKFDSKSDHVIAFDSDANLDRKELLLKYTQHKGAVLETTITLVNYQQVELHANNIANVVSQQLADHLEIDKSNLDYLGFLHTDTKHPHLHIQVWQREPFLGEYKLKTSMLDKLEKAVSDEMKTDYPKEDFETIIADETVVVSL